MFPIHNKRNRTFPIFEFVVLWVLVGGVKTSSEKSEMISLQNKTHIVCATDDKDSPIFVDPPSTGPHQNMSPLNLENSDWKIKNSQELFYKPVTDKRWEDFETRYGNHSCFTMKKHVTISVFNSPNEIELFADDDNFMESVETTIESEDKSWTHYYIQVKNEELYFYMNNKIIKSVTHFIPTNFCFRTKNATYYKLHNYSIWYSKTLSEKPTELTVSSKCLLLYVSVCPDCLLHVNKSENQIETIAYSSDNNWQMKNISLGSNQQSIYVTRTKKNPKEQGYWALDVRQCPTTVNNKVIYSEINKVNKDSGTIKRRCYTLESKKNDNDKKINTEKHPSPCPLGRLGKKCDVKCSKLLGEGRPFCEEHLVCENDECKCAWGYQGDFCRMTCENGYWGFDCKQKCAENKCKSCHHITGNCTVEESISTGHQYEYTDPQFDSTTGYYSSSPNIDPKPPYKSVSVQHKTDLMSLLPAGNITTITAAIIAGIAILIIIVGLYIKKRQTSVAPFLENSVPREEKTLMTDSGTDISCN